MDRTRLTQHGMMVGTVAYMPPEQALGGETTPQADLYSLGAMLYELVTGRPPFPGDDPTAVISQHINTRPVAPSWNTDTCPPDLEELILQLLEKVPIDRPESAAAVLEVLDRVDPARESATHDSQSNPLDRLRRGVFVGRERELDRLRETADEAFAGRGSVVMLVGEPGIGKTRTVQELETYARMRGATVAWGRSHEAEGAPAFWPWVQVARSATATLGPERLWKQPIPRAEELVRILPEMRELPGFVEPEPITDPESAQFRLFDAYTRMMRQFTEHAPLLLVLDDLHWADKPTLLLLQHVARELASLRVLVVGTYRDTELSRTHPLSETLAELNRGDGFARMSLRGLSAEEVADYVRAAANVEPSPALVQRVYEETEGNPFFLSEVVNLMTEEGTLDSESVSDIAIPEGVKEALGRRLDRLSEEANELLSMAAVVGREFTYETLTLLEERDDDALLRLIEETLDARVVEETEDPGRYRFTHALMQETLLAELSTTRRVRLHGQVGEALERRWGARAEQHSERLAQHFVESATLTHHHRDTAIRYSRLAAEQAEAATAWAECARHYERCLELAPDAEDSAPNEKPGLLAALGRCQHQAGDPRAAWRNLLRAVDLYREQGDWRGTATTALEAATMLVPVPTMVAMLSTVLESPGARSPELEARLLAKRARILGPVAEGDEDAAAAAKLAKEHDLTDVSADLTYREADKAAGRFELAEASRLYRRAWEQFHAIGRFTDAALSLAMHQGAIQYSGPSTERMEHTANEAYEYCREVHQAVWERGALDNLVALALARCRLEEARELHERVSGQGSWTIFAGRIAFAEFAGTVEDVQSLLPPLGMTGGVASMVMGVSAVRARALHFVGDDAGAREAVATWTEDFREWTTRLEDPLLAMFSIGYLGDALAELSEDEDAQFVYDFLSRAKAVRSFGGSAGDAYGLRGALALRLGLDDEAEAHFREGVGWYEQQGWPVVQGRCLLGLAEVAERAGRREEAAELLDRAIALFQEHGHQTYLRKALAKKEILRA